MKNIAACIAVTMLLTVGSVGLGRNIIWDGGYQSIEDGGNMKQAPATITLAGDSKQPTGYLCSFELDGKAKEVSFTQTQCTRVGSHVLCTAPRQAEGKPFTGDMCWGDIHLKKPHPAILGK